MASSLTIIHRARQLRRLREERQAKRLPAPTATHQPSTEPSASPDELEAEAQRRAAAAESDVERWFYDPLAFFAEVLGIQLWTPTVGVVTWITLWSRQVEVIRAIAHHTRVAVRSGHKVGKTLLAVLVALWWVATRPRARVIVIAPTERQVERGFWYELRQLHLALRRRGIDIMPEPPLDPATGLRWVDGREIFGFSATNPDNVSGPSGADVLVIVDESAGVSDDLWQAIQGVCAGGGHVLALGNPTQPIGWFIEAFRRSEGWKTLRVSSEESPNVVEGREVIPGLALRDFVEEIARDYGRDSAAFSVRVKGDPPKTSADTVIGLGLVEAARARWDDADHQGSTLDIGVDVALYGDDDSVIVPRRGLTLYSPKWLQDTFDVSAVVHGYDAAQVAGQVLLVMRQLRRANERVRIKLDAGGGYGSAVASHLRELQREHELDEFVFIIEINVATSPEDAEKYPQLRDELWFNFRAWLEDGGTFSSDARLETELQAPKYSITRKGQLKVDDKKAIKKTIGRSPDAADAACLAVHDDVAAELLVPTRLPAGSRWDGYAGRGFG